MLIVSKQKDFYDGVVGTVGVDKTIVYNRNMIEIDEKNYPLIFKNKYRGIQNDSPLLRLGDYVRYNYDIAYGYFIIGFCGKLYVGWKMYSKKNLNSPTIITYDFNQISQHINGHKHWGNIENDLDYVNNYDALPLFRELNTPVFVYDGKFSATLFGNNSQLVINPILNNYNFYKVVDSFTAFQEIQMFLGGVLGGNEKEIIEVADKYKILGHGYDKWSFRKEKQ